MITTPGVGDFAVQTTTTTPETVPGLKPAERSEELHSRIQEIQSQQLRSMLDRQNELIEKLEALANLDDVDEAEKRRRIIESELVSVRAEIAKRQEDVGVLAFELFGLYDEFGLLSTTASEDTEEDKAKRTQAQAAIDRAKENVGKAKAKLSDLDLNDPNSTASRKRQEIEDSWNFITKDGNLEDFEAENETAIEEAQTAIAAAEKSVEMAEQQFAEVEAQIEIDKADRVRKASLSENFALISQFTKQAVTLIREDIDATEERRVATDKALASALNAKAITARDLDAAKDDIARLERDLQREQTVLDEIIDQGSSAFAEQQKVVAQVETQLTAKRGEELKLNTRHMALTGAIAANKSSLAGLVTQRDTAEVFVEKLVTAEKTAQILGKNIDRIVKNSIKETATDVLDKAHDKMIMTAHDLGIAAEVASGKVRNDAIDRHDKLMAKLTTARDAGDQAMATEAARYLELDAKVRKGYADRGIDLDMSHLQAAAEAFESRETPKSNDTDSVSY